MTGNLQEISRVQIRQYYSAKALTQTQVHLSKSLLLGCLLNYSYLYSRLFKEIQICLIVTTTTRLILKKKCTAPAWLVTKAHSLRSPSRSYVSPKKCSMSMSIPTNYVSNIALLTKSQKGIHITA